MTHDLVYEIGTEEIPAGYLPPAARQLRESASSFFAENHIVPASVETEATPRRLVLFAKGLPDRQEDRTEEVTGPPWKAAFDEDGAPTKAAQGFARGRGLAVEDLRRVETDRGPYVGATVHIAGRSSRELLAEALPALTAGLSFPKTMRWGGASPCWPMLCSPPLRRATPSSPTTATCCVCVCAWTLDATTTRWRFSGRCDTSARRFDRTSTRSWAEPTRSWVRKSALGEPGSTRRSRRGTTPTS